MREPLPEQMTVRLYNGMRSIDLTGKSSALSDHVAKEQFVIFMSNLLKGNADEKITIIMRMIDLHHRRACEGQGNPRGTPKG